MKRFRQMAVCLTGALVLSTSLCAETGNPYEPIVTRNIFGLNPPQANTSLVKPEPPSKITVDGIMTIFGGTPQALFKVAFPPRPPKPATEKSYVLSEGQGQDGIEVTHIDVKNGMVTFNNNGITQEIQLTNAPSLTTPTPVVMHAGITPAMRTPLPFNRGAVSGRFGDHPAPPPGTENNGGNYANNGNAGSNVGSPTFGSMSSAPGGTQDQQPLSPEEQALLISMEHAHAQQVGDPTAPIFPPTQFDDDAGVQPPPTPGK
jgi:hypothetical protein